MKKITVLLTAAILCLSFCSVKAYAAVGQMGFFGGIIEGTRLPKTTEILLSQTTSSKKTTTTTSIYKEMVFLGGTPQEVSGTLTVKAGVIPQDKTIGTYKTSFEVKPNTTKTEEVTNSLARNISFNVNFRKVGTQTVTDYSVASWSETITIGEGSYVLDPKQSHYDISILEDKTAGVNYYKGDISAAAVYVSESQTVTMLMSGTIYGYDCAWSNTETHRLDVQIITPTWQMQYQIRPSVSVNKVLQYSSNEPQIISFEGNYREVMSNQSGLAYDIFVTPQTVFDMPKSGTASISTYNSFEQLTAPDLSFLKGNAAEGDISKLFAMQILSGEPKYYQPSQKITRGQFVTMLVKAVKLPLEPIPKTKNSTVTFVFPDVLPERADYPYIMAAYKAGLATGRGNGHFYVDYTMQRQEAIALLIRTIGLSNLGLDPTPVTQFADDAKVADWAKKELYVAYKIGLIQPDSKGNINPTEFISKAEAAAHINRLIEYMRTNIKNDYVDNIVNYAK